MTAHTASGWIRNPLAEALLRFNMLPSLLVHPRRDTCVVPPELKALPALHRHRSAALLKEHGLAPVVGLDDPTLPLAMLPAPYFERMLVLLGAALNAPQIRRTIAREEISLLKEQLGNEGLAVVRMPAAAALAGLPGAANWEPAHARATCTSWGAGVLARAWEAGAPEVAGRARLRLPPEAESPREQLAAAGLTPQLALQTARALLQSLEPAWLSSFPATR